MQGILTAEASGGSGEDLLSAVAILEGIGYGGRDNGLVFSVVAHAASCAEPLATFGSDAQRQRVAAVPRRRQRHRRDRHHRTGFGIECADAGHDRRARTAPTGC